MVVEKELKNCHDPYAMVIKMPLLSNIPGRFITFKRDSEWTVSLRLDFVFFGVWLGLTFDFAVGGNVTDPFWVQKFM